MNGGFSVVQIKISSHVLTRSLSKTLVQQKLKSLFLMGLIFLLSNKIGESWVCGQNKFALALFDLVGWHFSLEKSLVIQTN